MRGALDCTSGERGTCANKNKPIHLFMLDTFLRALDSRPVAQLQLYSCSLVAHLCYYTHSPGWDSVSERDACALGCAGPKGGLRATLTRWHGINVCGPMITSFQLSATPMLAVCQPMSILYAHTRIATLLPGGVIGWGRGHFSISYLQNTV